MLCMSLQVYPEASSLHPSCAGDFFTPFIAPRALWRVSSFYYYLYCFTAQWYECKMLQVVHASIRRTLFVGVGLVDVCVVYVDDSVHVNDFTHLKINLSN